MTLRRYPKLVLINQKITEDKIVLQVDGMPLLKLPLFMTEGEFSREIKLVFCLFVISKSLSKLFIY